MTENSPELVEFVAKEIRDQINILLSDYAGDDILTMDDEFDNATEADMLLAHARLYVYNYLRETWLTDKPRANEERLHGAADAAINAVREWDATHAPK